MVTMQEEISYHLQGNPGLQGRVIHAHMHSPPHQPKVGTGPSASSEHLDKEAGHAAVPVALL